MKQPKVTKINIPKSSLDYIRKRANEVKIIDISTPKKLEAEKKKGNI